MRDTMSNIQSPKLKNWHRVVAKKGKQKDTVRFCEEHCETRHHWHNSGRHFYFKNVEVAVLFKMTFLIGGE